MAAPAAPRPEGAPASLPMTAMQAEKGDPAALLRLGEMYWYGDGAPLDRKRGDLMFARAAAAGSTEAAAALQLSAQRQQQLAAIDWWTAGYQGADLGAAESACKVPAIPQRSTTMAEAEAVDTAYEAYRVCYNGLVDRLYGVAPAARIPPEVAIVMSEAEFNLASSHLDAIYEAAKLRGQQQSANVAAARAAWASQTVADITTHAMRRRQQIANAEAYSRAMGQALQDNIRPERPPPANVTGR